MAVYVHLRFYLIDHNYHTQDTEKN